MSALSEGRPQGATRRFRTIITPESEPQADMRRFDVVTFGETMLRLSPPGFGRLEEAVTLDVRIGGSESNTAVALARLGL